MRIIFCLMLLTLSIKAQPSLDGPSAAVFSAAVVSSDPVTNGIVGWWKFDDGSGSTATDSSGNGNAGTITGASWVSGRVGSGALSFDGVNDLVDVGSPAVLDDIAIKTVTAWVYLNSYGGSSVGRIFDKQSGGGGWFFCVNNTSTVGLNNEAIRFVQNWSAGGQEDSTSPLSSVPTGAWYHVAAVYDRGSTGNRAVFYVNGTLATTTSAGSPTAPVISDAAASLVIGNRTATDRPFNGSIDDVRIYNRALTAAEIAALAAM